jgi:hypothetical protein
MVSGLFSIYVQLLTEHVIDFSYFLVYLVVIQTPFVSVSVFCISCHMAFFLRHLFNCSLMLSQHVIWLIRVPSSNCD